jgi:hypothetical protein
MHNKRKTCPGTGNCKACGEWLLVGSKRFGGTIVYGERLCQECVSWYYRLMFAKLKRGRK